MVDDILLQAKAGAIVLAFVAPVVWLGAAGLWDRLDIFALAHNSPASLAGFAFGALTASGFIAALRRWL